MEMERRQQRPITVVMPNFFLFFLVVLGSVCVCEFSRSVEGYKNYTVGDSLGWFDNLEKPDVNYQKWAASKNFSLGDFLIFNTDNNHSVVQTYNFTIYKSCDYSDALDNNTVEWTAADPSAVSTHPLSAAVPLVKVGMTYFFSSDYDGEQCQNGQQLKINVSYGQGLPESLKTPSSDALAPSNSMSGDDESAPETLVPSNFDHPQDVSDDDTQASNSLSSAWGFNPILILLACIFSSFFG